MQAIFSISYLRKTMAFGFSGLFFMMSIALSLMAVGAIFENNTQAGLIESFLKAINFAVISLAVFELGIVVNREYAGDHDDDHIVTVLRRTLPRFVSIVCVALVLEGLLMVIKYSQLDLAGNLYYPVAIICSAAFLLISLGVFLRFSNNLLESENADKPLTAQEPRSGQHEVIARSPSLIPG